MKRVFRNICTIALFAYLLSCGSAVAQERTTREEYVVKWRHLAIENMEVYGIPASITMAQALLESAAGNSQLSQASNNHFGIKCKSTWTGGKVYHDDDAKGECFRAYPTIAESYADHAEFLNNNQRYDSLFAYDSDDYRSWAKGLKAAGYATAPDYAERLIKIIEEEHLYLLDRENGSKLYDDYIASTLGIAPSAESSTETPTTESESNTENESEQEATTHIGQSHQGTAYADSGIDPNNFRVTINAHKGYNVYLTNGSHYIVAKRGDSYESLGKLFEIAASTLRRYNDVSHAAQLSEGDIVYIERKAARWKGENYAHTAKRGETMHFVAQTYGIRLDQLSKLNRIRTSDPLADGQTIKLR